MSSDDHDAQESPFRIPWLGPEPTGEEWREMLAKGYFNTITGIPLIVLQPKDPRIITASTDVVKR